MNAWAGLIIAGLLVAAGCALVLLAFVRWLAAIIESRGRSASQSCGGVHLIGTGGERHGFEESRSFTEATHGLGAGIGERSRRADRIPAALHPLEVASAQAPPQ